MYCIGNIIGDICGSSYEWNNPKTPEDVELFKDGSRFTDDTVLTVAVADWLMAPKVNRDTLARIMKEYVKLYGERGYGGKFRNWVLSDSYDDYGSFGNGSGMRVAPVGFFANTLEETMELAEMTAKTTHGHPEGIKGAQAIAVSIFLAKKGVKKDTIKEKITSMFGYDLTRELDEIGTKAHRFDATCQVTVPEAIICFLKSNDFEDCIKKAISIGGDTDTIACMAGGIAEAYYGVPFYLIEKARKYMDGNIINVLYRLSGVIDRKTEK